MCQPGHLTRPPELRKGGTDQQQPRQWQRRDGASIINVTICTSSRVPSPRHPRGLVDRRDTILSRPEMCSLG
jgi:hypothetical protein